MNWDNVKFTLNGEELKTKSVNEVKRASVLPKMQYYLRIKNKFFFRSLIDGKKLSIVSNDTDLLNLKKGEVIDIKLDFALA